MTPFTMPRLLEALHIALAEAERRGSPSGVCLVDDGGHVLLHARQPTAPVAAADSALSKARTAVWLGADTGALSPTSPIIPAFTAGVPWPVAVFPGGRVLRHVGRIVGGIGVGGSTNPDDDDAVARAAWDYLSAVVGGD